MLPILMRIFIWNEANLMLSQVGNTFLRGGSRKFLQGVWQRFLSSFFKQWVIPPSRSKWTPSTSQLLLDLPREAIGHIGPPSRSNWTPWVQGVQLHLEGSQSSISNETYSHLWFSRGSGVPGPPLWIQPCHKWGKFITYTMKSWRRLLW